MTLNNCQGCRIQGQWQLVKCRVCGDGLCANCLCNETCLKCYVPAEGDLKVVMDRMTCTAKRATAALFFAGGDIEGAIHIIDFFYN